MNLNLSSLFLFLYGGLCCSCMAGDYPEVERARRRGAEGRVTLRITDSIDVPVEDAKTSVAFWASDSSLDVISRDGTTDTNGYYVATGKTRDRMGYLIEKDGYYSTHAELSFYRPGEDCVRKGRWQPWNPTNTIILKEHRNPTPMYALNVDASIPLRDKPAGYDLEIGDWIAPYGKGEVPDLWITYSADIADILTFSNRLVIAGNHQGDGFQRNEKEAWSSFVSAYEAPLDGYLTEVVLSVERTRKRIIKREVLSKSEYLFVRTRTILDQDGNISSARYAKIYGPIEYGDDEKGGGIVRFTYFFNPTPNDRNMEFDRKHNLMTKTGRGTIYQP